MFFKNVIANYCIMKTKLCSKFNNPMFPFPSTYPKSRIFFSTEYMR